MRRKQLRRYSSGGSLIEDEASPVEPDPELQEIPVLLVVRSEQVMRIDVADSQLIDVLHRETTARHQVPVGGDNVVVEDVAATLVLNLNLLVRDVGAAMKGHPDVGHEHESGSEVGGRDDPLNERVASSVLHPEPGSVLALDRV